MGQDLAAIHLSGGADPEALRGDLKARGKAWLNDAARDAAVAVDRDFDIWRAHWKQSGS
jgi:hypothetical protein